MSGIKTLAESTSALRVYADDNQYLKETWFKSQPVDQSFCYRVAQLQLWTDSRDQGWVSSPKAGSYSWFEVAIFEDENSTAPKMKDDRELSWRSHENSLTIGTSRHFGTVFDRRAEILDDLEVRPSGRVAIDCTNSYLAW